MRRLLPLALVILSGFSGHLLVAQVHPFVLEDSPRPLSQSSHPPRRAVLDSMWEVESGGTVIDGFLAGPGGVVYAVREGKIRSISPANGDLIWESTLDGEIHLPPVGLRGRLFQVVGVELLGLAALDGRTLWRAALPGQALYHAATSGPSVIVPLSGGLVAAFRADTGASLWTVRTDCSFSAPLGLGHDLIILGCADGTVMALDQSSGQIKWSVQTNGAISTPPVIYKGLVFAGNDAGEVLCLKAKNGRRRYRVRLVGGLRAPMRIHDKMLLVGALDNLLYAFRLKNGHLLWSADVGTRVLSPPALRGNLAANAPHLSTGMVITDMRNGAVISRTDFVDSERLSAAGPVFAGPILVASTRPLAGGQGWVTGFSVTVEEQDELEAPPY